MELPPNSGGFFLLGSQWGSQNGLSNPPDAPGRARRLPGVVGHRKYRHARQRVRRAIRLSPEIARGQPVVVSPPWRLLGPDGIAIGKPPHKAGQ